MLKLHAASADRPQIRAFSGFGGALALGGEALRGRAGKLRGTYYAERFFLLSGAFRR